MFCGRSHYQFLQNSVSGNSACTLNFLQRVSLVTQTVKNPPIMQETCVSSMSQGDPLEDGMATHCSSLTQKISWTEEPGGLQSMGSQRVGLDLMTNTFKDFPGDPVVKTPRFHCRRDRLYPWLGNKDPICLMVQQQKIKFDILGFPGGSDGEESACNVGDLGSIRKIPQRREWLSTPVFLPRESHGQRSLVGYSPWGLKKSDMTEKLTLSLSLSATCIFTC